MVIEKVIPELYQKYQEKINATKIVLLLHLKVKMTLEQLELTTGLNKIDYAISLIREYEPPEGYYLGFSGGKDSQVLYDITLKSGVKFDAHYCVSPIDPPDIFKFIRANYPDVIWDFNAKGFWKQVIKKVLFAFGWNWFYPYSKRVRECQYENNIKGAFSDDFVCIT